MSLDAHGDLHRGDVPPPSEIPRRSGSTIWKEPLTESERSIIVNVLAGGSLDQTRRWLRFCLEIFDAQAARPS